MRIPEWASVAKEMAKTRVWADVFHIIYTIHFLGVNLIVFDFESGVIYCGTHSTKRAKTCPTFLMAWVGRTHFEPIFQVREGKAYATFFHDDDVLKHVLAKYDEQGCPKVSLYHIFVPAQVMRSKVVVRTYFCLRRRGRQLFFSGYQPKRCECLPRVTLRTGSS